MLTLPPSTYGELTKVGSLRHNAYSHSINSTSRSDEQFPGRYRGMYPTVTA